MGSQGLTEGCSVLRGMEWQLLLFDRITVILIINSLKLRIITYLLLAEKILLEKLTGFEASQEIPRIYGTRKFITVLTRAPNFP
jgi:hypothetical protein